MPTNAGTVVANFLTQALLGRPLTVYGDGRQTRTFCYIDDMLAGIVRFAMGTPGDFTGPLNLGCTQEYSIRELAEIVLEVTGSRSQIDTRPPPPNMPRLRCPEISLARQAISWEPKTGLVEGLTRTAGYFRERLASGVSV